MLCLQTAGNFTNRGGGCSGVRVTLKEWDKECGVRVKVRSDKECIKGGGRKETAAAQCLQT